MFRDSQQKKELIKTKKFWISVVAVIIAVCVAFMVFGYVIDRLNHLGTLT